MRGLWLSMTVLFSGVFGIAMGVGINDGVVAEEMGYNPVHDAAWKAAHAGLERLSARDGEIAWIAFAGGVVCTALLLRTLRPSSKAKSRSWAVLGAVMPMVATMAISLFCGLLLGDRFYGRF